MGRGFSKEVTSLTIPKAKLHLFDLCDMQTVKIA